jgi:hypothetical protein
MAHLYVCVTCNRLYTREQVEEMGRPTDSDLSTCPACDPDEDDQAEAQS